MNNERLHIINGDILSVENSIICQQVNCLGIAGAGLALQIKKKYPNVFIEYEKLCKSVNYKDSEDELLGTLQIVKCSDSNYVANMFGQREIGYTAIYTRYDAFTESLNKLMMEVTMRNSEYRDMTVAMPYGIACGLGGGNWNMVYHIINSAARYFNYDISLYRKDAGDNN